MEKASISGVDYTRISQEVKNFFLHNGITITAAASRLGLSQQSLSQMLSGRRITGRTADILASEFPFSKSYLLTGEGTLIPDDSNFVTLKTTQQGDAFQLINQSVFSGFIEHTGEGPRTIGELVSKTAREGHFIYTKDRGVLLPFNLQDVFQLALNQEREIEALRAQVLELQQALGRKSDGDFHPVADLAAAGK